MSRKEAAIQFKLQQAGSALMEAEVLLQNMLYNGAVNRMYYACFYAAPALLLTKDLAPKTHKGVETELHKNFVFKGSFDKAKAGFYKTLMQDRQDSDYGDFLIITKEQAEQLMPAAKEYIDYISTLLTLP